MLINVTVNDTLYLQLIFLIIKFIKNIINCKKGVFPRAPRAPRTPPRAPRASRAIDGKFPRKLSLEVSMKLSLEVS